MSTPARARRPVVAVCGPRDPSPEVAAAAFTVGGLLIARGARLATGGLGGAMEAASRGARTAAAWVDGDVIGVLPGADASSANPFVDIAVPTGAGLGRNLVLVQMADAVIAIGGGAGTLSEIALAWQLHKRIVVLDLGEGWSSELGARALDGRRTDTLLRATTASEAAALALGR